MKRKCGLFGRLVISFSLFATGLALIMGFTGYIGAKRLSLDLLASRSDILMDMLVETEKQSRRGGETEIETSRLLAGAGLDFLVGKQLSPKWTSLGNGLHLLEDHDFVYIRHTPEVSYALRGSLDSRDRILSHIGAMFILCGLSGLGASVIMAFLLSKHLAAPFRAMANFINKSLPAGDIVLPPEFAVRNDEAGLLARVIINYQESAREHLEREKSFTGAVSHELRTPLTVIAQGLELLEARLAENRKAVEIIQRLARTCGNMSLSLNALLELARGERKDFIPLDMGKILLAVLSDAYPDKIKGDMRMDACGQESILQLDQARIVVEGKPAQIRGKFHLAWAVMRNLIENAIRHNGGREIRIKFLPHSMQIVNSSNFEARQSQDGLGLLIASRACARMDWKLAQTGDDHSTIFTLNFPLKSNEKQISG